MPPATSAALAAPLALFARQSIGDDVGSVKSTFSSWDNCMAKSYCKYPVIIAIVVGSLIALSIIFCLVRCCCCGLECCCGVCACFNACCPSPRGGRRRDNSKYRDPPAPPPFQPSPYNGGYGYASQPPPVYNSGNAGAAQFAQFDTAPKNADALPAMPGWDSAVSRRVEDTSAPLPTHHDEHEDGMELGTIEEQKAPMLANQAPAPHGGNSPYHGPYSDNAMPYQRDIAHSGGDLGGVGMGSYESVPTYRGAQTTGTAVASGAAGAGQQRYTSPRPGVETAHGGSSYSISPPTTSYTNATGMTGETLPSALSAGTTGGGSAYRPQNPYGGGHSQGGYNAYQGYRDV